MKHQTQYRAIYGNNLIGNLNGSIVYLHAMYIN